MFIRLGEATQTHHDLEAWRIGATDATAYFLLNLILALAFTSLFVRLAILRLPERKARLALTFFFVLPESAMPYF